MKRILFLVPIMLLILSGCGKKENEIRVSWWGSNERNNATLEAIDLYNASQDEYTVVPEYYDYESYSQKFSTQMAGNQGACVAQIDQPWLINYSSDDFIDLTPYVNELQLENYDADLLDSVTMGGSLISLPASSNTLIYTFDKSVYDEAGVEIPTTWEEMLSANEKIQNTLGDDYYAIGNTTPNFLFMQYIYQMTGHLPLDEAGNWIYTKEDITIGVDGVTAFLDSAVPPVEVQPGNLPSTDANFVSGNIAGYWDWVATYTNFAGQWPENDEVATTLYMKDPNQVTNGLFVKPSMAWSIPSSCENVDGAIDFMSFLTTNDEAVLVQEMQRGVPANSESAKLLKDNDILDGPLYEAYQGLAEEDKAPFPVLDADLDSVIFDSFEDYRYGDISKSEIVQDIMDEAEAVYS